MANNPIAEGCRKHELPGKKDIVLKRLACRHYAAYKRSGTLIALIAMNDHNNHASGICGSDLHWLNEFMPTMQKSDIKIQSKLSDDKFLFLSDIFRCIKVVLKPWGRDSKSIILVAC